MKDFCASMTDEEQDDDWYCQSISRYNDLIMFDLEDKVVNFDLTDETSVCLLCKKSSGAQIILQHRLPLKLYKNSENIKSTDMKIKTGLFPSNFVLQMRSIYNEDKLITSEEDLSGFRLYNLKSGENFTISAPLLEPKISILDKNLTLITRDTSTQSYIVDLSGNIKNTFKCSNDAQSALIPIGISQTIIALCIESNGAVDLYDTRNNQKHLEIQAQEESSKYTICSNSSTIGTLGTNGVYNFYDIRDTKKPVMFGNLALGCDDKTDLMMKFSPSGQIVSISGHDGTVVLYKFDTQLSEIFSHDGHEHMEHNSKNTIITDHLWYDEKCLISSADNHSLNCWQYVIQ